MHEGVEGIFPESASSSMNGPDRKSQGTSESSDLTTVALSNEAASPDVATELTACDDSGCSLDALPILTAASKIGDCTLGPCKGFSMSAIALLAGLSACWSFSGIGRLLLRSLKAGPALICSWVNITGDCGEGGYTFAGAGLAVDRTVEGVSRTVVWSGGGSLPSFPSFPPFSPSSAVRPVRMVVQVGHLPSLKSGDGRVEDGR